MAAKTIPTILTDADWQKKKGAIAKMAGETGLGAAMKALAVEWKKVDWAELDPDDAWMKSGLKKNPANYDKLFQAAKSEHSKVEGVRVKVKALRDLADKTEKKFKASKLIPSSSTQHVGKIKVTADQLWIELKSIDKVWAAEENTVNEKYRKDLAFAATNMKKNLKSATVKAEAFVDKVRKDLTVKTFNTGIQQAARDITQNMVNVKKIKAAGMDLDLDYPDDLADYLVPWAQSKKMPDSAQPKDVTEELDKFEDVVEKVKAWGKV
jgi:hypothetical protein